MYIDDTPVGKHIKMCFMLSTIGIINSIPMFESASVVVSLGVL